MKRDKALLVITSISPTSSAGLPLSIEQAMAPLVATRQVSPGINRLRTLFEMARTIRFSRQSWSQAYEKLSYTVRRWHEFSSLVAADPLLNESSHIIQVGLLFNSFPPGYAGFKGIFLHGTLSMLLHSKFPCTMWMPPAAEIDGRLRLEQEAMVQADRVFLGAGHLYDEIRRNYEIDPKKLVIIGTGRPSFPPLDKMARIEKTPEPSFLFVGKDFKRKGGEVLLDAFQRVRQSCPEARLHIVGPRSLGRDLPENVSFHGMISDRNLLQKLFLQSHVFVLPTLHDSFGLVFLEAMHFNLPCIGTDIFAVPEIISHGETGLIVPPGDVTALAEAMVKLAEDMTAARQMGERGHLRAEAKFNWKTVADRIAMECGLA